jgi:hypothetical protein
MNGGIQFRPESHRTCGSVDLTRLRRGRCLSPCKIFGPQNRTTAPARLAQGCRRSRPRARGLHRAEKPRRGRHKSPHKRRTPPPENTAAAQPLSLRLLKSGASPRFALTSKMALSPGRRTESGGNREGEHHTGLGRIDDAVGPKPILLPQSSKDFRPTSNGPLNGKAARTPRWTSAHFAHAEA